MSLDLFPPRRSTFAPGMFVLDCDQSLEEAEKVTAYLEAYLELFHDAGDAVQVYFFERAWRN